MRKIHLIDMGSFNNRTECGIQVAIEIQRGKPDFRYSDSGATITADGVGAATCRTCVKARIADDSRR